MALTSHTHRDQTDSNYSPPARRGEMREDISNQIFINLDAYNQHWISIVSSSFLVTCAKATNTFPVTVIVKHNIKLGIGHSQLRCNRDMSDCMSI